MRIRFDGKTVVVSGAGHGFGRCITETFAQLGARVFGFRGAGGRAAWCGAARKDLDNDHAATAARTWRTMIGPGVWIGGVVHCRRLNLRHCRGHQLPGARDVRLAAGAGQQPVVADAMSAKIAIAIVRNCPQCPLCTRFWRSGGT